METKLERDSNTIMEVLDSINARATEYLYILYKAGIINESPYTNYSYNHASGKKAISGRRLKKAK